MSPATRKLALVVHVITSVGWLGAVAAFLALAVAGLVSREPQMVRAAYLAAKLVTWGVIVPACFASLLTGVIQSLCTPWGLLRHYWVLAKLLLTLLATAVLLLHTMPIDYMADMAAAAPLGHDDLREVRVQLVFDAGAALCVLLVTTVLSVFKPRGVTAYGQRRALTA